MCESSGRWHIRNSPYSGGLQIAHSTWRAYGGTAYGRVAADATPAQQILIAKRILAGQGWGAWPVCSRKIGAR